MALSNRSTRSAALAAAAMAAVAALSIGSNGAEAATANANYSAADETGGDAFVGSSFQAAGNAATSPTGPSDKYPAFGSVAFATSAFASLASTGVTSSATLTATEFPSTTTSTGTHAGSIIDIYFAEAPQTPANTTNGFADSYDTASPPGGFDAADFSADLVGSVVYANVAATVDTIPLTLSSADVAYIDSVLSGTTTGASFELFAVATQGTDSAKYDGSFTGSPAVLTLNAAAVTPEPTSALVLGSLLAPMALSRRRAGRRASETTQR